MSTSRVSAFICTDKLLNLLVKLFLYPNPPESVNADESYQQRRTHIVGIFPHQWLCLAPCPLRLVPHLLPFRFVTHQEPCYAKLCVSKLDRSELIYCLWELRCPDDACLFFLSRELGSLFVQWQQCLQVVVLCSSKDIFEFGVLYRPVTPKESLIVPCFSLR